MKYKYFLILLLWLPLSGCATSDDYSSDQQQGPPSMSGNGGGPGGGGGSRQGGPPGMNNNNTDTTRPLPDEAFTACKDKKAGDYVVLTLPDGKELKATCQLMDDQMVAVPQEKGQTDRK